jgi:phosphonate transport system substrate-binding protein
MKTLRMSVLGLLFCANAFGFSVGIVPQFTPTVIEQTWTPILAAIEAKTGQPMKLKHYKNISEFEAGLKKGEVDFAYMNPYHAVMFKKKYEPIVRDDKKKLTGVLVVRADSPYKSIKDLNGKKIAFPSPNAFAASLLIRSQLSLVEKINFETVYASTHSNTFRSVLAGDVEAGGGVNKTLKKESQEVLSKLRILYTTPETSPHPFCANKKLSASIVKVVQEAFITLDQTNESAARLNAIEIALPVITSYKKDYEMLEKMRIKDFVVAGGE